MEFCFFISILGVFGVYTLTNETGIWRVIALNFVVDLPSGFEVSWIWTLLVLIGSVTMQKLTTL